MSKRGFVPAARAAVCVLALGIGILGPAVAQQTALTIYSSARPGAIPPELYRPVPGQASYYGQSVPGYAMIRQTRRLSLERGINHLNFRDVAAYIDPTTVSFESLTAPRSTRVIEQSYQFDLVSGQKLMDRYIDQIVTVDQLAGDALIPLTGTLLSTEGGLILGTDDGRIHSLGNYQGVHYPSLPGGLITRPTLVWDVSAEASGRARDSRDLPDRRASPGGPITTWCSPRVPTRAAPSSTSAPGSAS
jgi:hypothetical protein